MNWFLKSVCFQFKWKWNRGVGAIYVPYKSVIVKCKSSSIFQIQTYFYVIKNNNNKYLSKKKPLLHTINYFKNNIYLLCDFFYVFTQWMKEYTYVPLTEPPYRGGGWGWGEIHFGVNMLRVTLPVPPPSTDHEQ